MKTTDQAVHFSIADRQALGEQAKDRTAHDLHSGWRPAPDRPDPVSLLEAQNRTREPDLVPVRHGRMMVSPFTFYRGTATVMAADLAATPTAGLEVQLCGDAHLSNFGAFASPERQLLFDLNDFDETLPGPFEYDLKRLAASFVIAARNNSFSKADAREATLTVTRHYREAMAQFAELPTMDLWYARMSEEDLRAAMETVQRDQLAAAPKGKKSGGKTADKEKGKNSAGKTADKAFAKAVKRGGATLSKARGRNSLQALAKLTEVVDGQPRIVSQPPVLIPMRELHAYYGVNPEEMEAAVYKQFDNYRSTLTEARRQLLDRFQIVDMARKVVGVGSVGTRAFIVLLEGRDKQDPLFLQVKEATRSVLEAYLPNSRFTNCGERVVQGQQMMQSASDIFLGWSEGIQAGRYYYWRQLRDMKAAAVVETMIPAALKFYAQLCGWTLARAHARSGDAVAIASYLGTTDRFDQAITDFAERYADQTERDYKAFRKAIKSGRIPATEGV